MNLPELDRRTRRALEAARTIDAARAAIATFLDAFDDPHLRIATARSKDSARAISSMLPPTEACSVLGYKAPRSSAVDWEAVAGFERLPGGLFLHGVVAVQGRKMGVLRIPSFLARHYPELCMASWKPGTGECGEACQRDFRHALEEQLVRSVDAELDALRARKVTSLVVDITANGGGNDWVDDVAKLLSPAPAPCARVAIIRHDHWRRQLDEERTDIEERLAEVRDSFERTRLVERRERVARLLKEVRRTCDRTPLWRGERLTCSGVVEANEPLLTCSPERAPVSPKTAIPLVLLVDGRTSSAAEYLAVRLKDYGGAQVIGARTAGAGCGMTNGGVPVLLPRIGVEVELPDCIRFRRDGRNEREGVEVDVSLGEHPASGWSPEEVLRALGMLKIR